MGDQLTPNVLTVDPDGRISAALSGSLRLPADEADHLFFLPDPKHSVRWVEAGGAMVAASIGVVTPEDCGIAAQRAFNTAGDSMASVEQWVQPTYSSVEAYAATPSEAAGVTIIDSGGYSNFLKFALATDRLITTGVASTPGAGTRGVTYTVRHGLGRVPQIVIGTMNNAALLPGTLNYTATTFDVGITSPGLAGWGPGAFQFTWLAIG